MKILEKRQNNDQWKKVEVIQTCIKARIGCGEPVFVHFFAPIDETNPGAEIEYDYQSMPTDADLVLNKEDQIYAYKQCLKFCYYISKVRGIEILQMKAEFLKDENQFIWFYYAHNIYCRKNQNKNTMNSEDAKKQAIKLQQSKERQRQKMVKELEDYEQQQRSQKSAATQKMLGTMNSYYQTLKSEVGFEDNQGMDDEDYELDDILRTLKPNTTARNFKEFLGREHNCNRTQAWRSISRKIYSQD